MAADLLFALTCLILTETGYLTYLVLHRCCLSPLAKIPGPRLAAITYWYECYYDVFLPAQYTFKIEELHEIYGPVVRIGPNDVSISDPNFVDTIYAPGPGHRRDKYYDKNKALGVDSSVGGSISHDLHLKRREALNLFFSPQRIIRPEEMLSGKINQIEGLFTEAASSGRVINLLDIYFAFSNDNSNIFDDPGLDNTRRKNVGAVLSSVKVMLHFGWIRDLMKLLPLKISTGMIPPGVRDMMEFRKAIRAEIDRVTAQKSSPDEVPSIFSHLRDNPDLPASEKTPQRLEDEATLMTMAGTYSPMLSLVIAHYHLLARPDVMEKLRTELAADRQVTTTSRSEKLPYLSAIIQEAHRLTFGLTGRNPRVCPNETITYKQIPHNDAKPCAYSFPPATSLSSSTLLIHTNTDMFPEPWDFRPERWLTTDQTVLVRRRRCMLSFIMRGPRAYIGKHLANAKMAALLTTIARWEMVLYETTADDVEFRHDYHVLCPSLSSEGVRAKVLGRAR